MLLALLSWDTFHHYALLLEVSSSSSPKWTLISFSRAFTIVMDYDPSVLIVIFLQNLFHIIYYELSFFWYFTGTSIANIVRFLCCTFQLQTLLPVCQLSLLLGNMLPAQKYPKINQDWVLTITSFMSTCDLVFLQGIFFYVYWLIYEDILCHWHLSKGGLSFAGCQVLDGDKILQELLKLVNLWISVGCIKLLPR